MPDPLFQTLFDDTEAVPWAPSGVVRDRARARTRRTRAAALAAATVAVVMVVGGVALAGRGPEKHVQPGISPTAAPSATPSQPAPTTPAAPSTGASSTSASSQPAVEPTALIDSLFLQPSDLGTGFKVAPETDLGSGDWTTEFVFSAIGCSGSRVPGQIERRDRSVHKGTGQSAESVGQYVARHKPGTAAQYFDDLRAKIAACQPGNGKGIRIKAQRFAGQDSLRIEYNFGDGWVGDLIVVRQGDLVTQFTFGGPSLADQGTALARKAASRMCNGTPVC
ncbi:hypothetical protein GCM10009827_024540 [Dactylosporangium maewongense]|uniref:PknH-like extracellular domain-containing protein n=1 Tax=Dactylosporangium maewongense TaxID=634393 RepID=A0ABN2A288_9ACTN